MKLLSVILPAIYLLFCSQAFAQSKEFGMSFGATEFWGELGGGPGNPDLLRHAVLDTEISQTRYTVGILYRHNLTGFSSMRFNGYYARIDGDDKFASVSDEYSFFRAYRNLNFKSVIIELSAQYEQNFMRYLPGRRRFRFSPHFFAGAGVFYFNPKAKDGTALRPLRTEGQGSAAYPDRKPYSNIQPNIVVGLGIKYYIGDNWNLGFEYGYRFTFTDYIDDVSKTYPDPAVFTEIHGGSQETTQQALAYSRRSTEHDFPLNQDELNYITEPGQQRGDPSDYDHYIFTGVITLTYTFAREKIYCPVWKKDMRK